MTDQIVKSPCGAADLLAAIFGKDSDIVRAKYHLPLKHTMGKHYGWAVHPGNTVGELRRAVISRP